MATAQAVQQRYGGDTPAGRKAVEVMLQFQYVEGLWWALPSEVVAAAFAAAAVSAAAAAAAGADALLQFPQEGKQQLQSLLQVQAQQQQQRLEGWWLKLGA